MSRRGSHPPDGLHPPNGRRSVSRLRQSDRLAMRPGLPVKEGNWSDWIGVAVFVPTVSLTVSALIYFLAKKLGRWFVAAVERSFGQVVLNVMAPDMARLGIRIASSLDELRESNSEDHRQTGLRLTAVETRQTD